MLESGKKNLLEIATVFLYAALLAVMSYYHEPWFDESQAWLIARDSSLFDMVWNVLRYEGHTPLWHLALYIPAHAGVPFEPGIKLVNAVFAIAAAALFIRRSPFPLAVRLLTPFTYFLFYQYGVISRCYSLLVLMLWIVAVLFPERKQKPFRFSLTLVLLGGVTAYGMLIAFGITAAWMVETFMDNRNGRGAVPGILSQTLKDRRLHAMMLLGLINTFYAAMLWPMPDKFTPAPDAGLNPGSVIYRLLIAPLGGAFLVENPTVHSFRFKDPVSALRPVAGLLAIAALLVFAHRKKMLLAALLPWLSVTLFMTFVYYSLHHSGIYTLLALYILWISQGEAKRETAPAAGFAAGAPFMRKLCTAGIACILAVQIYWTAAASVNDIRFPYAPYREIASYIKEKGLDRYRIFDYYYLANGANTYFTKNLSVLPYFSKNLFYNHNPYRHTVGYAEHRRMDDDALIGRLKSCGKPDIILGYSRDLPFYGELFSLSDYEPVESFVGHYMWKNILRPDNIIVYIRKDLISGSPELAS